MRTPLLLVVLAAGCYRDRAPAETATPPSVASLERPPEPWPSRPRSFAPRRDEDRCARVVAHIFQLMKPDATSGGISQALLDELQAAGVESCHETAWSDDLLSCCEGKTASSEIGECLAVMTEEQRDDMQRRFRDIQRQHLSAPPPPPPSP